MLIKHDELNTRFTNMRLVKLGIGLGFGDLVVL